LTHTVVVLGTGTCKKVTYLLPRRSHFQSAVIDTFLERSPSFWQVTPHDSRHLSQRLEIPCSILTKTLTWTMMRNTWLPDTETYLLWTSLLIQHIAYLQLVLPSS